MARPLRIQYPTPTITSPAGETTGGRFTETIATASCFWKSSEPPWTFIRWFCTPTVLMGNHFHMIVETPRANLSEFMRHFNITYTVEFNRRHRRVGHLYQGRYKAILVDKDGYLAELSRYVHLNPVRVKPHKGKSVSERCRFLERYKWSSLLGYLDPSKRQRWINYEEVLAESGGTARRHREFIDDGLREGYKTPWEKVTGQVVLAREEFVAQLGKRVSSRVSRREQPSVKTFQRVEPEKVLRLVSRQMKVKPEELIRRRTPFRDARAVAIELLYRYSAIKQREIGKRLGEIDYSAVSRERTRLRQRVKLDRDLAKSVREIESVLDQR